VAGDPALDSGNSFEVVPMKGAELQAGHSRSPLSTSSHYTILPVGLLDAKKAMGYLNTVLPVTLHEGVPWAIS
jgi:hypothetical protein